MMCRGNHALNVIWLHSICRDLLISHAQPTLANRHFHKLCASLGVYVTHFAPLLLRQVLRNSVRLCKTHLP